jgi:hypothetical protein
MGRPGPGRRSPWIAGRQTRVLKPDGAHGDVQVTIPIQISDRQSALRGVPLNGKDRLGPIGVGVPDQRSVAAGDDRVGLAIAVEIRQSLATGARGAIRGDHSADEGDVLGLAGS